MVEILLFALILSINTNPKLKTEKGKLKSKVRFAQRLLGLAVSGDNGYSGYSGDSGDRVLR